MVHVCNCLNGDVSGVVTRTVTATLGAIANGAILGWSSSAQFMLESGGQVPFPVTSKDTQTFSSVFGIGAALGALPAGYVSGLCGRRGSMMIFEGFLLVGWIMLVRPVATWVLSVARMLQGVGAGALCATIPSYVGEIAEPQMRGKSHPILLQARTWEVLGVQHPPLPEILGKFLNVVKG